MNDILTTFADFHFLRPFWLWAILPLIIMGSLLAYFNKQQSGWQSVLAGHLYKHIISHARGKKLRKPLGLLTLGWIIATLALAGPTWQRLPQPVFQLHNGKVVLLDMSMSMRATDIKPNRLTRAKYKAIDLVKQISEGETGLVAYAGDAFTISPLSSDGQNLTMLIPSLSPEIMPIAGSEPALGLQAAIALLQNANYPQGEIFWITDGIDNQQMKEMSELLNTSPYRLSVLAVGTEEGAPIQMQNGELLKDNNGSIVLPKLTSSNLKTLAKQGGGRYAPMQADNSDIEYLVDQSTLGTDEQQTEDDNENANDSFGDKWQEMGPYLLLLLLPFAAYSFRRGLLSMVLLGLLLPVYTPPASAGLWKDMWQTNNQQGFEAFDKQQFDEAAQKFDDPLWLGSALYKNKDYENALKAFSQVDSPQGRYNHANTLAQLGKLPEAIKKYNEVLAEQPDHQDALANKALIEKLLEQQQSEQQQKSDQGQQQNQQQQDGDEQQDKEQQGDQPEQQNSEQQQQQDDAEGDAAEQQEQEQNQQNEQQKQESPADETKDADTQDGEDKEGEPEEEEQQTQAQPVQENELTDEEKEQMQRMQNLLNRVPDDPAFLLKRKMQIETQQRKRERVPANLQRNW
ncbi:VWA domain-containing protein [Paraglaciecola sp.]|uniref:vWA domain-containing protein n=1 Tax=Paraglaciecola sp. TaxID=1920173 RepID=UPI0030F3F2A4